MRATIEPFEAEKDPMADATSSDDFGHTFCLDPSLSDLQLETYQYNIDAEESQDGEERPSVRCSISSIHKMQYYAEQRKAYQIFYVGQKRSYSRLNITRKLFQHFVAAYSVFPIIWDFVQPFGFKVRHSDMDNPPFTVHQPKHKCAYSFRYAVLNYRTDTEDPLPDYDRWSIRQTVVYQQYDSHKDRAMFLLVSPSVVSRHRIEESILSKSAGPTRQVHPFELHHILISTHHDNWRHYIRDLETYLRRQCDRVTLSNVNGHLTMPFLDRQRLKMIEDKILDLKIIFDSLLNTIKRLRRQCEIGYLKGMPSEFLVHSIIDDLEEQMQEIELNVKRVEVLHLKAQATAQLISDALSYENAQVTNLNAKSLHDLAQESKEENSKMRILTERSTRDAAAVKILTVITLIYLPVTVVASIFSSQLIQVDDRGRISVISDSWWFIIISVPLTLLTFFSWRYWLSNTVGKSTHPKGDQNKEDHAHTPSPSRGGTIAGWSRRLHSLQHRESHLALEPLP
ncbi:hypothetical protein BKA64DRAFT_646116 [Cadophora sp. MPI-SDFR-AT-0126]|nr:hypothetical protein BKA64DRAFT_646116 [Leotiomycetes sp. MPI-SDFR-AT-0126]